MVLCDRFEHLCEPGICTHRTDQSEKDNESVDSYPTLLGELALEGFQVEDAWEDECEEGSCECALEVDELAQIWN